MALFRCNSGGGTATQVIEASEYYGQRATVTYDVTNYKTATFSLYSGGSAKYEYVYEPITSRRLSYLANTVTDGMTLTIDHSAPLNPDGHTYLAVAVYGAAKVEFK